MKHDEVDETDVKARLNDQIQWYDDASNKSRLWYKWLKGIEIFVAATIPFIAGIEEIPGVIAGICGVTIVILEGIQNMNGYYTNWLSYRSSCEELKHHKFLWGTNSGIYEDAKSPNKLLAKNVELIIAKEFSSWANHRSSKEKEDKQ